MKSSETTDRPHRDHVAAASEPGPLQGGRRTRVLSLCAAAFVPFVLAWPSLRQPSLHGLDQAHHFMGGLFFHDFLRDLPLSAPGEYVRQYYCQYPALGLTIWPSLFYAAEGGVMQVGGANLTSAFFTLLLFSIAMAICLQLALRRFVGDVLALLTVATIMTQPVVYDLQTSLMLEAPALAVISATVYFYLRLVARGQWRGVGEAILLAGLGALAVYVKQPAVFLFPGLLADLALNHRKLLKARLTWFAAGLLVALCVPLAAFTLKYGALNIAQSIGSQGNIYVGAHKVAERWSVAGWTYYAREMGQFVNPIALMIFIIGLWPAVMRQDFRRRAGIWLWGFVIWYLVFSYLDNKQPRFLAFGIPFLVGAGVLGVYELVSATRHGRLALAAALVVTLTAQVWADRMLERASYAGMQTILAHCAESQTDASIVYFGDHRQAFVPFVRMADAARSRYVLQGDDVTGDSATVSAACHDYQAKLLFVEPESVDGRAALALIEREADQFELDRQEVLVYGESKIPIHVYSYRGPIAAHMALVPLNSEVLQVKSSPENGDQ